MTKKLEARAFAIWRYANPREWDVSCDEIADATGLTRSQVNTTIGAKGWGGKIGRGRAFRVYNTSQMASLREKNKGHRFDENALDLCQIIGDESA
jgi:hypothetical protein